MTGKTIRTNTGAGTFYYYDLYVALVGLAPIIIEIPEICELNEVLLHTLSSSREYYP